MGQWDNNYNVNEPSYLFRHVHVLLACLAVHHIATSVARRLMYLCDGIEQIVIGHIVKLCRWFKQLVRDRPVRLFCGYNFVLSQDAVILRYLRWIETRGGSLQYLVYEIFHFLMGISGSGVRDF